MAKVVKDLSTCAEPCWLVEVFYHKEDDVYSAQCPDLPGFFAWNVSFEAALAKYISGLADYLHLFDTLPIPVHRSMDDLQARKRAEPNMRFSAFFTAGPPQGCSLTSFVKGPHVMAWVDEEDQVMIPEAVAKRIAVYGGISQHERDKVLRPRE